MTAPTCPVCSTKGSGRASDPLDLCVAHRLELNAKKGK